MAYRVNPQTGLLENINTENLVKTTQNQNAMSPTLPPTPNNYTKMDTNPTNLFAASAKPPVVGGVQLPQMNNSPAVPTVQKTQPAVQAPVQAPYTPPKTTVAPAPALAPIQTAGYDQKTGMPTGWSPTPPPTAPVSITSAASTPYTPPAQQQQKSGGDPFENRTSPDSGWVYYGNGEWRNDRTGESKNTAGTQSSSAAVAGQQGQNGAPTLSPLSPQLGPTPQEIEAQLEQERQRIMAKYEIQREQAKVDTENERKSEVSSLYSVGEVNPLSSGVGSISGASKDVLNRRLANIDMLQQAEISDATNRAYKAKSDYASNARQAQIDENERIQQQYTMNRQALMDDVAQVKASQERSDKQKNDSWDKVSSLLTTFGSQAFNGMDEEAQANLEIASGLPKGALTKGLKTLKEQEALGKKIEIQEIDGSLYGVTYDADGNFNAKQLVKGTPKSEGLTAAQINTTVNQIAGAFDNEPVVKNFNVVQEGYDFVKNITGKTKPTSADDQGLVYAFAKAMDPNSAVKEGEYITIQKYNQSLIQQGWANAKRIVSNEPFLTDEARQQMQATIQSKYQAATEAYNQVRNEYTRQIEDAYAGRPRTLTNYITPTNQPVDVRSVYEQAGFTENYDDMVRQYGEDGVKQILQEQGFLSP